MEEKRKTNRSGREQREKIVEKNKKDASGILLYGLKLNSEELCMGIWVIIMIRLK
jgi:hypothetical protein